MLWQCVKLSQRILVKTDGLKKIIKFFKKAYDNVIHSIAFYPVIISLGMLILAVISMRLDNYEGLKTVREKLPYFFITDYDTGRSILSTLIGGIISLMVFSFTMVMVVLNQASTNFSPRLLPNLVSNKRHQIILGVYAGTLLFCIISLISIGAYGTDTNSFGLTIMFAAVFGVLCIVFFIYFIHGISTSIQIHNIIDRIYKNSYKFLKNKLETIQSEKVVITELNNDDWKIINSKTSGYFRGLDVSLLTDEIKNSKNQIDILPFNNQYVWADRPILKIKESFSEEQVEKIQFALNISSDRHKGEEGIEGMIKLMEIAVKAMSPGINDPGTAIDAVSKLGQLLCLTIKQPDITSEQLNDDKLILYKHNSSTPALMRMLVQPIRLYSKNDNAVLKMLIEILLFIKRDPDILKKDRNAIARELDAMAFDIRENISNKKDREYLLGLMGDPI